MLIKIDIENQKYLLQFFLCFREFHSKPIKR